MTYCLHCGELIEEFYEDWEHVRTSWSRCDREPIEWAQPSPSKRFTDVELAAEYWRSLAARPVPVSSSTRTRRSRSTVVTS